MFQSYTLLERIVGGRRDGPGSGQKPSHHPMRSQWQPSPSSIGDEQARRMTLGNRECRLCHSRCPTRRQTFPCLKENQSANVPRHTRHLDSSRWQLLSNDRTVTVGTPRGLSAMLELEAHHLIILITEIRGVGWRSGSTGKGKAWCGTKHLKLELKRPDFYSWLCHS